MRKWLIDYAFRTGEDYGELRFKVEADYIDEAMDIARARLNDKSNEEGWDSFLIWGIGIIEEADTELL